MEEFFHVIMIPLNMRKKNRKLIEREQNYFTVKLICKQLNVSIGDFSCVPLITPVRVDDETTSCSSSASNTLHEITLRIKKKEKYISEKNNKNLYLRNKRGLTVRLAKGESQYPAVLDENTVKFYNTKYYDLNFNKFIFILDVPPEFEYC
jgi:hypothetical protein